MFTILSLQRMINTPSSEEMANKLLKLCKRNNNLKGIIYYSNWISKRKEFRNLGKLERQASPPIEAYGTDRNKIKFSKISYGLLFE